MPISPTSPLLQREIYFLLLAITEREGSHKYDPTFFQPLRCSPAVYFQESAIAH